LKIKVTLTRKTVIEDKIETAVLNIYHSSQAADVSYECSVPFLVNLEEGILLLLPKLGGGREVVQGLAAPSCVHFLPCTDGQARALL
jgi:hypothetical protein